LNDETFGNSNSWLGTLTGAPAFAGVKFAEASLIDEIAFGRDNDGVYFGNDRSAGTYTIQYTADDVDPNDLNSVNAANWLTIGELVYGAPIPNDPAKRHRYAFAPVNASGVRILVSDNRIAIDELEVHGIPEPSTYALGLLGSVAVGLLMRRRKG